MSGWFSDTQNHFGRFLKNKNVCFGSTSNFFKRNRSTFGTTKININVSISDETFVYVRNVGYDGPNHEGYDQTCGYAYQTDPENEPGRLLVAFFDSPAPPGDYLVLDTDYENYSAIFGCDERFGLSAVILTRENHPDSLYVSCLKIRIWHPSELT